MCGRFKAGFEFREMKIRWQLRNDLFDFHARYNIAPTQDHPIVVDRAGAVEARPMRWGLLGQGSGDRQQDDQRAVRDSGGKAGFQTASLRRAAVWCRPMDFTSVAKRA